MIPDILETAAQVAGIGGLALGVLLILFREVIRKKIFPNLSKEQAYRLLRMIVVLVFVVAIVGILAWVYIETVDRASNDKTVLSAEFVLDENKDPVRTERDDGLFNYKLRVSLKNVPPEVTSVNYDPWDSSYSGEIFRGGGPPDFKTEFFSFGDLDMRVKLNQNGFETTTRGKSLIAALEQTYRGNNDPKIDEALKQIRAN
jgi:hypothetical protein